MSENARVLVVEDEDDMRRILEYNLRQQGYVVRCAGDAAGVWPVLAEADLVVLDLRLPDAFGLDVLEAIKADPDRAGVRVIVVSALGDEDTVVSALNMGADDYVTKPFRVKELMARVSRVLRRGGDELAQATELGFEQIVVHTDRHEVSVAGERVDLTRSELALLAHFVRNPGRVLTRQKLCHDALGAGDAVQQRTIDAHVRTIRRKLGSAGRYLVTVWGIGYKMANEERA